MKELTEKMVEEAKALMDAVMQQCVDTNAILNMDSKELELVQRCVHLYNALMELAIAQAKMMDDMNAKLDKLLEVKEA